MSPSVAFQRGVLILGALIVVASCLFHQTKGALDFSAYYQAAHRFMEGSWIYVDETNYAHKYAPVSIFYFVPFALFSFDVARWLYASLHALVALAIPWGIWRLIQSDPSRPPISWNTFVVGLGVTFLGSFRFVDNVFLDSNVTLFTTGGVLLGVHLLRFQRTRFWGPLVIALATVMKVHALVCLVTFRFRDKKTFAALAVAALVIILIPNPLLWPAWWKQMQDTGRYIIFTPELYNLQGFYAVGKHFFGMNHNSLTPLLLAIPFGLFAFWKLPRFALDETVKTPTCVYWVLCTWVLWAFMSSPLPWQHTYSVLWGMLPLIWGFSDRKGRIAILAIAVFLGLTPRDIVGVQVFSWLESRQSVFFAVLGLWLLSIRGLMLGRSVGSDGVEKLLH